MQTLSLLHKDHGRSKEIPLDNYKSYKLSNDFTTLPAHDRLEDRQLLFYQFFAGDLFQCKPRILVGHYSTQQSPRRIDSKTTTLRTTKGKDTICNFPSKNYPRQNNDVSALWLSQHALTLFTHSSSCFFFSLHPHHAFHIIIPPTYKSQSGKSMLNMVQIQAQSVHSNSGIQKE